ncbi:response regulator transcription factor [Paenibacillus ferrarius]|uniref:response regulator transcription factor n=1 Tax=Paenibacillus ferrarius TaxID=1469647 RepID=UPI003D2D0501
MKLLVVEDEFQVRERIAYGIAWADYEIEMAGAVGNGREAVAAVEKDCIDLVITDIHMPDMSGLELAKVLKQEYPHVKIIILTGFDHFEYARDSIDYGVLKYLVKPAENEVVLEAVLKAKQLREQELGEIHHLAMLQQRWIEHLPHLKQLFYKNWLNGRLSSWELEKRSQEIGVSLAGNIYLPVTLDMDPIAEAEDRFQAGERPLIQYSLYNITRDVMEDTDGIVLQDDDGLTAVIFFAPTGAEVAAFQRKVNQLLGRLLSTVKTCLKLTASAGIGTCVEDPALLPIAYKMSRMALQERIVLGNETVIPYRNDVPSKTPWLNITDLEKEIEIAVETGNESKRSELIRHVMAIGFSPDHPIADAKEMILRITALLTRIVHSHGWSLRETLAEDYNDFMNFNQLLAKEQLVEWLHRMMARISRSISERRRSGTHVTVSEILAFVDRHLYEEELSLYFVAEKLYMNYAYASRVFKEVTGSSFSDNVLRLRMEKAKELLAAGCKVYEVAERVGYKNGNYFSRSFQKYWGIKPSEIYKP